MQYAPGERVQILIKAAEVQRRVQRLGERITQDYYQKPLTLIGILKGSFIFMADLIRAIDLPIQVDFMAVSSYGAATQSSGVVRILKDLDQGVIGRHVLVVEDIVDSGLTLNYIYGHVRSRGALSVKICCCMDKPSQRKVAVPIHYKGFEIPDDFIVGYGLDVDERYRNIPDICRVLRG